MKARTNLERRVEAITLPDISEPQKNYFISNTVKYHIFHNGKYTCSDCGKLYSTKHRKVQEDVTCPHCGCSGKSIKARSGKHMNELSYGMTTCRDGFQIIRMFIVWIYFHEGKKARFVFNEVYRNYINDEGRVTDMCVGLINVGYKNEYCFSNKLHIYKPGYLNTWATDIVPHYWYPKGSIIPKLKQRGFKGSTHDISPRGLMECLLRGEPKIETIFKAGYFGILEKLQKSFIDHYFGTIKIAIRHRYKAKNWVIWKDYITMCEKLLMDIRNPKIVCPVNLDKAHDDVLERVRRNEHRLRENERKLREKRCMDMAMDADVRLEYLNHINPYIGIKVCGNGITIKPIPTSDDFYFLGKEMHQCLATNEYYRAFNSVILSAWMGDRVVENMEISLDNFKVVQCFGDHNKFTEHHEQILELVSSKLISQIKKCYYNSKVV